MEKDRFDEQQNLCNFWRRMVTLTLSLLRRYRAAQGILFRSNFGLHQKPLASSFIIQILALHTLVYSDSGGLDRA